MHCFRLGFIGVTSSKADNLECHSLHSRMSWSCSHLPPSWWMWAQHQEATWGAIPYNTLGNRVFNTGIVRSRQVSVLILDTHPHMVLFGGPKVACWGHWFSQEWKHHVGVMFTRSVKPLATSQRAVLPENCRLDFSKGKEEVQALVRASRKTATRAVQRYGSGQVPGGHRES